MADSSLYDRIRFRGRPRAHADAVVTRDQVRFTVLTPRLLRLEWSETGVFEDRSTYAFPTRYTASPPTFQVREDEDTFVLDTGVLTLRYTLGSGRFNETDLNIAFTLRGKPRVWHPGMVTDGNLWGTRRTLDRCAGDASLEPGILSRSGGALFDDSKNVIFTDDGWVGPRPDVALQDWYFFGYGHDYKAALQAYTAFGGEIPMIPRFILGGWWSRYWAYSEQDLRDLVAEFEAHDVPLDVLVIDMDWHTPHAWTGYTWNRELFPDPPAFLKWVHDKGLRATLNLHPAQGVQAFEEVYPEFATALGLDPASGEPVPFRIADKNYVQHYFEKLHHPMEDDGVDFWWMDWQQGEISEVRGLDPLPWINHLHFNDIKRRGVRPMLYSRWGGLGNHRYHIGFSGDTYVTWEALRFQPHMTATASNVLYGWWSHDIGGHMGGATEPELYARWVQFGALSPVLRLHSTKDPRCERRPWAYPEPVARAAEAAFRWRYRLVPYLYTMARVASDTGISLCRPMYYENPEAEGAYAARYQYYLGDQMIAAPIVFPADPETKLASTDVWIPEGTWIAYDTLETFTGPRWIRMVGDLNRMPMLVKSGAILPLAPSFKPQPEPRLTSGTTDALPADELVLSIFPGEGSFRVYRDDGVTEAYRAGEFEWLPVRSSQSDDDQTWTVTIGPVEGRCAALPDVCGYEVRLVGSRIPQQAVLNGKAATWQYDSDSLTTIVTIPKQALSETVTLTATAPTGMVALGEARNRAMAEAGVARLLGDHCPEKLTVEAVLASGASERAVGDAVALLGGPFFHGVGLVTAEEAAVNLGRIVVGAPADGTPVDVDVTFALVCAGRTETHHARRAVGPEGTVLHTPFTCDNTVASTAWGADVTLSWEGKTLHGRYESVPFYPSIHRWHAVAYDRKRLTLSLEAALAGKDGDEEAVTFEVLEQDPTAAANLNEPFVLRLWELYDRRLAAGEALATYLIARVNSPEDREVVLEFAGSEDAEFVVNGEPLSLTELTRTDPRIPVHFRPPRRSVPFTLRAGENILAAHTVAPDGAGGRWFMAAQFLTPEGKAVLDLTYN